MTQSTSTPLCDELLNGIAVIIDDEVNDSDSDIYKLVSEIENHHIPCVKFALLPDNKTLEHFSDVVFIILDWNLNPDAKSENKFKDNIDVIKKITSKFFVPIFIFTMTDPEIVISEIEKMDEKSLLDNNIIFIKYKSELVDGKLFDEIENWLKSQPSAYVIKKWSLEHQKAKNSMFLDLYKKHPLWPKIFWDRYSKDNTNESYELCEMITKNLIGRCNNYRFNEEIILKQAISKETTLSDILGVWEGAYYIPNDKLNQDSVTSGDIFKLHNEVEGEPEFYYYINIKPECDCVGRDHTTIDDLELYLIRGEIIKKKIIDCVNPSGNKGIDRIYNYKDSISSFTCFGVCDGKYIQFKYHNIYLKKWGDIKYKREGRLTQPFIGHIQQRFSLYLQRQGLPPIPNEFIDDWKPQIKSQP